MHHDEAAERAAHILREGGLVALPTETVYGLAADASNELAVRRIFSVKGRPSSHPLIVHLESTDVVEQWAREIPDAAWKLAAAFWPGPLTLILRKSPRASDIVTGGQDTVGIRIPDHPLARAVLHALGNGGGVAAPSANRFGRISPTRADHVREDLGDDVDMILDGGPCSVGVESTIIDLSGAAPRLLRPGGVPIEDIESVLGVSVPFQEATDVRAPGTLASHYAPRAGLELCAPEALPARLAAWKAAGQSVAVMAPTELWNAASIRSGDATHIAVPGDAAGFARELYARLRDADAAGHGQIVAVVPEAQRLGRAVLDRLSRAAAPRT